MRQKSPEILQNLSSSPTMQVRTQNNLTAYELFFDGKLLTFWQIHDSEKPSKLNLKPDDADDQELEQGRGLGR